MLDHRVDVPQAGHRPQFFWLLRCLKHGFRVVQGEKVIINIRTFTDGHVPPDRVLVGVDV